MRKIPCPYCQGEVLSEVNGRVTTSASLFPRLQNFLTSVSDLFTALMGGAKTVSRKDAIGGECGACGGSGSLDDYTDTEAADQAVSSFLDSQQERINKLTGDLGDSPGGSRITRIGGADVLIVGHTFNGARSYSVKKDVGGFGGSGVHNGEKGRAAVQKGTTEHNGVVGHNVPTNTGGGQYIIQVANKFQLMAGSQGISLKTSGPIEFDGGVVSFTGADVSIGTSVGQTSVAGNAVVIEGRNIKMNPTGEHGQVLVDGSFHATGNLQGGAIYADNAYFAKLTMPGKQVSTKAGTSPRYVGGPASWGGLSTYLLKNYMTDLQKFVFERMFDINLFKAGGPLTPRFQFNLSDHMYALQYAALPVEVDSSNRPLATGVCISLGVGATVGVVYNFPHGHIKTDDMHTHEATVPATDHDNHTAETVRQQFVNSGGDSPVAATGGNSDTLGSLLAFFGAEHDGAGAVGNSIKGFFGHNGGGGGGAVT